PVANGQSIGPPRPPQRGHLPAGFTAPGSAAQGLGNVTLCSATTARSQGKATPAQAAHQPLSFVCSLSTTVATSCRRSKAVELSTLAVASATPLMVGCGIMAPANPRCCPVRQPGGPVSDSQW